MKNIGQIAILMVLSCVSAFGQDNGPVRFRGTVTASERHNVIPVCYGDYFVPVSIGVVLEDPNRVLEGLGSVEVCYKTGQGLVVGDCVEVYGFYWGGTCPKQYCRRAQIIEKEHYITRLGYCCPDGDWQVSGSDMYSIPPGDVGIGTSSPEKRLHVVGEVLIDGRPERSTDPALTVMHAGDGRQLAAYLSNPQDGNAEVELQMAGGKMLPWGWSLKAASGLFTLGSIMVVPPALNITSLGNVGLGVTSPTYRLELPNVAGPSGRGRANAWTTYSSIRWKTKVRPISQAMEKVRQLEGVRFEWKDDGRPDIGLIAEQVGKVVPEVVDYQADSNDAIAIDYGRLVALLVEAIKQQDARIAELERTIQGMQQGRSN